MAGIYQIAKNAGFTPAGMYDPAYCATAIAVDHPTLGFGHLIRRADFNGVSVEFMPYSWDGLCNSQCFTRPEWKGAKYAHEVDMLAWSGYTVQQEDKDGGRWFVVGPRGNVYCAVDTEAEALEVLEEKNQQ